MVTVAWVWLPLQRVVAGCTHFSGHPGISPTPHPPQVSADFLVIQAGLHIDSDSGNFSVLVLFFWIISTYGGGHQEGSCLGDLNWGSSRFTCSPPFHQCTSWFGSAWSGTPMPGLFGCLPQGSAEVVLCTVVLNCFLASVRELSQDIDRRGNSHPGVASITGD